jgi:ThiF family
MLDCEVKSSEVLLGRRLSRGDQSSYPGLAINALPATASIRVPWVAAEPPLGLGGFWLEPRLPLGQLPSGRIGYRPDQPFLETILSDEHSLELTKSSFVLFVGRELVRFYRRRPSKYKSGSRWIPGSVAVSPFKLSSVGVDPNLKGRKVGIVGTGSIGGRLAMLLGAGGVKGLVLVDPDYMDIRNLRRHVCGPKSLGQPKVEAISDLLVESGHKIDVEAIVSSLPRSDSLGIREHLASCDVLVSCADSGPAQHYVNHLARYLSLPAVIASVKLMPEALGEIVHCLPNSKGCLNCWRLRLEDDRLMMREDTHDPADYPGATVETPQGLPEYLLDQIAAVACNLVSRSRTETEPRVWLNALEKPVHGFEDLRTMEPSFSLLKPVGRCLVCGGR